MKNIVLASLLGVLSVAQAWEEDEKNEFLELLSDDEYLPDETYVALDEDERK